MELRLFFAATMVAIVISVSAGAHAATITAPTGLAVSAHIGWKVDKTTGENICTVISGDGCRSGTPSSGPGGFGYLSSVATDPRTANLYVTDVANNRVQEFTATGEFVATFGWDVNQTRGEQATATQAQKNVCTALSGDVCTSGVQGTAAGQFTDPSSIAVDPLTGDLYVTEIDIGDFRVDKYTSQGRFVWMIGKHVNGTTEGNICTARELERAAVKCTAGAEASIMTTDPYAFKFAQTYGDLLTVGGPEDLLYVGDEHSVKEFDAEGRWKREILLASLSTAQYSGVAALVVDPKGDLYLVYHLRIQKSDGDREDSDVIRKFNPRGEQVAEFPVESEQPSAIVQIDGLAIDYVGRLAVLGTGAGPSSSSRFGSIYDGMGHRIADFTIPSDFDGLAFNNSGDLYIAATDDQEVVAYVPSPPVQLVTSVVPCELGSQDDAFSRFNCTLAA